MRSVRHALTAAAVAAVALGGLTAFTGLGDAAPQPVGAAAPETHEVATSQGVVGALIGHSPVSLSLACRKVSVLRARGEVHRAKSDDCAKLPQRTGPTNPGIRGFQRASKAGLRGAVVMVGGRPVVGLVGACEN